MVHFSRRPRINRSITGCRHCRRVLVLAVLLLSAIACETKVVRVPVTPENARRASEFLREGDILFARREYYPALMKYVEAGRLNPNSEIIQNKMGISYSAMGFYLDAETALRRALALNPKFVYAYNNLGTVYFAQSDFARAQKFFKKAIEMENRVASFHINLGQALMESGEYTKGLEEIRKGIRLDPTVMDREQTIVLSTPRGKINPEKSYNMSRIYAQLGDIDKSIKHLREAIENGFTHLDWINSEPDFDLIRDNEKFATFLSEARIKYRIVP